MEEDADGVLNSSWSAQYYSNPDLSGSPVLTRTDADINFNWGTGSPGGAVPSANFSVRWTASMDFVAGGLFNFTTTTNDGVRLYVDNTKIIDKWVDQSATWTASLTLASGYHTVVMEYYERTGTASASLSFRHNTLFTSVLAQEIGHNLGFDHVDCAAGDSVMGSPICSSNSIYPTYSTQVDRTNWDRAYYPDAPGLSLILTRVPVPAACSTPGTARISTTKSVSISGTSMAGPHMSLPPPRTRRAHRSATRCQDPAATAHTQSARLIGHGLVVHCA